MPKIQPILLAALLAGITQTASAYDPYQYWAGPAYVSDWYPLLEHGPYFTYFPPVYYGYSLLLPKGDGFTMRSYSPDADPARRPPAAPLLVKNPYVKAGPAEAKAGKEKPASKQGAKVRKASWNAETAPRPTANPYVTPKLGFLGKPA